MSTSLGSYNNPAKTYTFEEFIDMQSQDDMTYINFCILCRKYVCISYIRAGGKYGRSRQKRL